MPKDLAGKRAKQELIATSSTIHRRQHTSKQTKVSINQLHGHPSLTQTTTNHTVYTTGTTHRHTKHHPHYNGYTPFTNKHQMHQTEPQTERTAVPCAFGQFCTYSTIFDTTPVVAKEHKKHSISAKTCRDRAPNRETVWSNANTETKSLQQTIRSVVDNNINQFGSRSRVHNKCYYHWNARRWNPTLVPSKPGRKPKRRQKRTQPQTTAKTSVLETLQQAQPDLTPPRAFLQTPTKEPMRFQHSPNTPHRRTASVANMSPSGKPSTTQAKGLTNIGNSCFMNATLQCIAHIPTIKEIAAQHTCTSDGCVLCWTKMHNSGRTSDKHRLFNLWNTVMGRVTGHQKDAYHFFYQAMSQNELAKPFTATETTTTTCLACRSTSHPPGQMTYATTVNITGDTNHTIASLMQLKDTREVMEGENKYRCEKCNKLTRQENRQPHATTQLTTNTQLLKSQGCSTNVHNTAGGRARHTDQPVRQLQERTQWQSNLQGDNGDEQKEVSSKSSYRTHGQGAQRSLHSIHKHERCMDQIQRRANVHSVVE